MNIPDVDKVAAAIAEYERGPALPCEPAPVVNGLELRKKLGRKEWGVPVEFGCCGWQVDGLAHGFLSRIIVTADHRTDTWPDIEGLQGNNWIHASISHPRHTPDYQDLQLLHRVVFGDRWAYQVFAPGAEHVNIHPHALHLFGRTDGARVLPDFGQFGTI